MKEENTYKFIVRKCPEKHAGLGRVLINYKKRDNSKRFQIVRILTQNGLSAYAAVIGHYDDEQYIKMDYDLRSQLEIEYGDTLLLEITRCNLAGTLYWYVTARDPLIRVPAVLASISVLFGCLSIVLALSS